ncbi:hypothetical protein LJC26_06025 [Desulfovibrio sp. OttesenSCG-928-O18]|nr:hypothetical protein [Desulfovibrio sp. OttesenSCG-928-O18]
MRDPRQLILPRMDLAGELCEALQEHSLVLLTAPMGYGKTLTARETMTVWTGQAVYTTVAPGGNDIHFIWDRVAAQLEAAGLPLGKELRDLGPPTSPPQTVALAETLTKYTRTIPLLWVVDDAHTGTTNSLNEYFTYLLSTAAIPNLHILILSRTIPQIPIRQLQVKGQALHFRQDFLRFLPEETRRFFSLYGINDAAAATAAHEISEGWPAAALLLAQAHAGGRNIVAMQDARDSTLPELDRLIEESVYLRRPPETQRLLLHLAVADPLTQDHAIAITGDPTAGQQLMQLYDENSFIDYDMPSGAFRMHPLLRSLLLSLLRADLELDIADLYRRSGEWLYAAGRYPAAVHAFAKAGRDEDLLRILDVFAEQGGSAVVPFDPKEAPRIVLSIPWELKLKRITGYLAFAFIYQNHLAPPDGQRLLTEAEEKIAESTFPEEEKRRLTGEITLARAYSRSNDVRGIVSWSRKAARLLRGPSSISGRRLMWTFGSPHIGMLYTRETGAYAATVRYVDVNLPVFARLAPGCGSGGNTAMRAEFLLETATSAETVDRAETVAHLAIREAEKTAQTGIIVAAGLTLARIALLRGKAAEAMAILDALEIDPGMDEHPMHKTALDAARGYTLACAGTPAKLPETFALRHNTAFAAVVHGKTLFLQRRYAPLAALCAEMQATFVGKHAMAVVHAKILAALAENALHGPGLALPLIQDALEATRADSLVLPLAEYGETIVPLIDLALKEMPQGKRGRGGSKSYLLTIKAAATSYPYK